jgi:hypothetical protein
MGTERNGNELHHRDTQMDPWRLAAGARCLLLFPARTSYFRGWMDGSTSPSTVTSTSPLRTHASSLFLHDFIGNGETEGEKIGEEFSASYPDDAARAVCSGARRAWRMA